MEYCWAITFCRPYPLIIAAHTHTYVTNECDYAYHPLWKRIVINKPMHVCLLSHFSCVQLCATLWTVAHQTPLSMGFSKQEYWGGLPCSPTGDLPNPGIKSASLMSPALAGRFFTTSTTWEALNKPICEYKLCDFDFILDDGDGYGNYLY